MASREPEKPYRTSPGNKLDGLRGDEPGRSNPPAMMQTGESMPYDVSERHVGPATRQPSERPSAEKASDRSGER